jgi:hypothetical protein
MNHVIRKIDADGEVTLFAGTPEQPGLEDGSLTEAMFYEPMGLAFMDGALYVADSANHVIRKIKDGAVTTIAGNQVGVNPETGYPSGGFADGFDALFNFPRDLVVMPNHDIYVADTMNNSIRLISGRDSYTRTIIGNGEAGGYYGSVENLKLSKPSGIATDGDKLYITDTLNNKVVVVPITDELNEGRPLREDMLRRTGASATEAYTGEPRIFVDGARVEFNGAAPWNTREDIYIPVLPLFEALGAFVEVNSDNIVIAIDGRRTVLPLDGSYFMHRRTPVMPDSEFIRLFPFTFEWFPEFSVAAIERRRPNV